MNQMYSTNEHTYTEHIQPLIAALDKYNVQHNDVVETFEKHSMIGSYFKEMIKSQL